MRRALVGSGMDLVDIGERFRHAMARVPPSVAGLRPPGVTNMQIMEVFWDDIEKARRRGVGWGEIAEELARAGVHKLNGGLFQATSLSVYARRKRQRATPV